MPRIKLKPIASRKRIKNGSAMTSDKKSGSEQVNDK
jgi:hypothetical protein